MSNNLNTFLIFSVGARNMATLKDSMYIFIQLVFEVYFKKPQEALGICIKA